MRAQDVARALQESQLRAITRDAMAVELVKAEEAAERARANYREACDLYEQAEAKARALRPQFTNTSAMRLGVVP